jgi:hypothetical protein
MKTQHTTGPWATSKHATPEHSPQVGVYAEGKQSDLAIVRGSNAVADASLIAAAPELLELAMEGERLANIFSSVEQTRRFKEVIAKATGES